MYEGLHFANRRQEISLQFLFGELKLLEKNKKITFAIKNRDAKQSDYIILRQASIVY